MSDFELDIELLIRFPGAFAALVTIYIPKMEQLFTYMMGPYMIV
jgi:hypothetical protein